MNNYILDDTLVVIPVVLLLTGFLNLALGLVVVKVSDGGFSFLDVILILNNFKNSYLFSLLLDIYLPPGAFSFA